MFPCIPLASTAVTTMLNQPVRRVRRGFLLVVLALVGGAAACEDPFEITANYPNIDQSLEVWAITGSPASYPSGILMVAPGLPQASAARLDASGVKRKPSSRPT